MPDFKIEKISRRIARFNHRYVDPRSTTVSENAGALNTRLFDYSGIPVLQEHDLGVYGFTHGFVVILDPEERSSFFDRLYISPRLRGKGIGRGLVVCLIEAARETGLSKIGLSPDKNTSAASYWEKHGFEFRGEDGSNYMELNL